MRLALVVGAALALTVTACGGSDSDPQPQPMQMPMPDGGVGTDTGVDPCDGVDCSNLDGVCVQGACQPDGTCMAVPRLNGTTCDDGDLCTDGDICTDGTCGGVTRDCSGLDDQCNTGTCNPANGMCEGQAVANGTACDDGSLCTVGDSCQAGVCDSMPVDCSGLDDQCNTGTCNPGNGVCEPTARMNGTACDDGSLCTFGDSCVAGTCTSTAVDCSGLDDDCNTGFCNPADGACMAMALMDGTVCDDGSLCSVGDTCFGGTCTSTAVDCSGLDDQCNDGVCNVTNGACEAVAVADGTTCSDEDACTEMDACAAGACEGSTVDCSDLTEGCLVGICDTVSGCGAVPVMAGTTCDDLNPCTTMDACDAAGLCIPGSFGACGAGVFYAQDFENDDGGWTTGGANSSWAWGSPTGTFIGAPNGESLWVTNLSGSYNDNEDSYIESPPLDFSRLTADPIIVIDFLYETESCCDEGWMEISLDGGATFTKLGAAGQRINWYNDASNQWWDGRSGDPNDRLVGEQTLTGAGGVADVRVRFRFRSDGSVVEEGFGLDAVTIREGPVGDLEVVSVQTPENGCSRLTGPIEAVVRNNSTSPLSGFEMRATGATGTPLVETVTATIPADGEIVYTFGTPFDSTQSVSLTVTVDRPGDAVSANNSLTVVTATPTPSTVLVPTTPFIDDFESSDGGWTVSGANPSWAYGAPTGPVISSANSGVSAWVTNPAGSYNDDERSFMTSVCYDLTAFTADPRLDFAHNFETESCCDEGWVEMSTDGGVTWSKIGTAGTGTNWYNDSSNDWWEGTSGGWRTASNQLVGAAGQIIRIRFVMSSDGSVVEDGFAVDDFSISGVDNRDLAMVDVLVPPCGGNPQAVVRNNSSNRIDTFSISIAGVSGQPITDTVMTASIAPGAVYTHTFSAAASLASGTATVTANHAGDAIANNNTQSASFELLPSVTVGATGYSEGFESGPGDWVVTGANPSWALGTPTGTFIPMAATGTSAWVTNLSGGYNNNERSGLESLCFDMSSLASDPTLEFSLIFETESCCDEGWVEISLDGGISWSKLGTASTGTNWYNDSFNDWWDGTSGAAGTWRTASHPMTGAAGEAAVRVRFVMSTDISLTEEGFGVDDIEITP